MDLFVARQPILDQAESVYGYELLFRDGIHPTYRSNDPDGASSQILAEGASRRGLDAITGGRFAFVNVTRELLVSDMVQVLPPKGTVLELLEDIPADEEVMAACRRLRESGYRIALDDFTREQLQSPLLDVADVVKVDFKRTASRDRRAIVRMLGGRGKSMLAEKVETRDELREAREAGYQYFQGYFFSRPVMVASRCVSGVKLHYLEVLREIQRPSLDFVAAERIIKNDVSLCFRLLRYANSAQRGGRDRVRSVGQALLLVGEREFRRLIAVLVIAGIAEDQPEALVSQALTRARFCELLAPAIGRPERAEEAFLTGMLSLLDTMLGRPMGEVLRQVALAPDVDEALQRGGNELGRMLEYVLACEQGVWRRATALAGPLRLDERVVPAIIGNASAYGHALLDDTRNAA